MEQKIKQKGINIGGNIRQIRKMKNIGQTELARMVQLNDVYMTREDSEERGKMLKNRGFEGMREIFHLETTFFGFCGGKSGKISVGDGENHCLRMMIFLLM